MNNIQYTAIHDSFPVFRFQIFFCTLFSTGDDPNNIIHRVLITPFSSLGLKGAGQMFIVRVCVCTYLKKRGKEH